MEEFYKDALRFGCLQGFKHFSLYLRGREELLVTVFHGDDATGAEGGGGADTTPTMDTICESKANGGDMGKGTAHLPAHRDHSDRGRSPRARPAKAKTVQSNVLVPASPASREARDENPTETVFLVGAYAKYDWPYVWLRSNHKINASRGGRRRRGGGGGGRSSDDDDDDDARDLPLDLITTQGWETGKYRVWDIVEELVSMNVFPNPVNPFALNHAYFKRQPQDERYLVTGAMVSFLRDLLADTGDAAEKRMGLARGDEKKKVGDNKEGGLGRRLAGLSLNGSGGDDGGRKFTSAVEADMNQLVATHLAAMPGGLIAQAAR